MMGATSELYARFENALNAVYGNRVPRDSDDLAPLRADEIEMACDADLNLRAYRKGVIV